MAVLLAAALASGAQACGSGGTVYDDARGDAGAGHEAGHHDAGRDAPRDVLQDVSHDTGHDSSFDAAPSATCDAADIGRNCVSGPCSVTGPASALPSGATVTVAQIAVPSNLAGDAVGPSLCQLTVTGAASVSGLTLTIAESTAPPGGSALFEYTSPAQSTLVQTSQAVGDSVEGLVAAPGSYGVTVNPGTWSSAGTGGVNVNTSADEPSLLRNLSSEQITASFYDGKHLFVCNGPRVLVYNSLPTNPGVLPDVVLGQPDVDTIIAQTTSALFAAGCAAIWSDGTRLAVGQGSRLLIWQTIPTASQTPADLVLAQPDFSSNRMNNGGVSAESATEITAIDSSGTNLVVADELNNRVLVWNEFPTLVDQPADLVIGQPDATSSVSEGGAVPFADALGAAISGSGAFVSGYLSPGVVHVASLASNNPASDFTVFPIADTIASNPSVLVSGSAVTLVTGGGLAAADLLIPRVLVTKTTPSTGPSTISFILGQPAMNFMVENAISASVVQSSAPSGTTLGRGSMFTIPDANRLLLFAGAPAYNFEPATAVIGQAGFTTNGSVDYRGISPATLAGPSDVASADGTLAVADTGNNRVLIFAAAAITANDPAAATVLGQADFTSFTPNVDQVSPSASTLSGPAGVALDGTHLIVADTQNHRVLIWNTVPTANGQAANIVLGQSDFTGSRPNHGNGDSDGDGFSDADDEGMFYPTGVASDGTHLFVADRVNHRVLVWSTFPTADGQAADSVIGQSSFSAVQANSGNGGYIVVPTGFNLPTGVTLAGTTLWVADTENNRVVQVTNATTTPAVGTRILGQANGTSVSNPNYFRIGQPYAGLAQTPGTGTATTSVLRPRSVVFAGDRMYVSETDSNRVHMFDATSLAPLGELGQTADSSNTPNASGVSASSLATPEGLASDGTHLWVADSANHRVLGYGNGTDPTTGAAASVVLGQVAFLTNGFNQSSTAANGVTSQPRGLSVAGGRLYVADTGNHRVLSFATPLTAGDPPTVVFGQPNGTFALPNSGGSASATTLDGPRGVYADGTHVFVADTANNRVLMYLAGSTTATLVLGQASFSPTAANAGGPNASTMQEPSGVFYDGTRLWVADTGNHRVLAWNALPTTNGQAADLVLGQTTASAILSNQGTSDATASDMSFPAAIQSLNGVVYIADSGNNRVLSYSTVPTATGASADGVLGQPNLTSRTAATSPIDLSTLAGPVGLAADAENLYVSDRDLARGVVYHVGGLATSGAASIVLGAAGGLSLSGPGGIAVETTAYFTSRVYVANSGANNVAIVGGVSRLEGP